VHRFFVSPDEIDGDSVTLSGAPARQLARVLRFGPGERIVVLDDSGREYLVTLEAVSPNLVSGVITDRWASTGEPATRINLYQAVLKADRFEFVLQKGTELGVSVFVPILCARSVPRGRDKGWLENRYGRWRRIITEAAEQSHRGRIPVLENPVQFFGACDGVEGWAVIPWKHETSTGLKTALAEQKTRGWDGSAVGVFIGPEGGFTDEEIDYARARGIVPVSMGRRVLRAETAGIAATAAILYELNELGG
jgi:16S rRNA (uracil1498-N3)-methyltransferase